MAIKFQFQSPGKLSDRQQLKLFIKQLMIKEGKKPGNITIVFCSDDYLLDINRQFLSHDYYTDIITFDLSASALTDAELYISLDRVKENAVLLQQKMQTELHRVIFHGILHLCGYGDKTPREIKLIRSKEDEYLDSYFK